MWTLHSLGMYQNHEPLTYLGESLGVLDFGSYSWLNPFEKTSCLCSTHVVIFYNHRSMVPNVYVYPKAGWLLIILILVWVSQTSALTTVREHDLPKIVPVDQSAVSHFGEKNSQKLMKLPNPRLSDSLSALWLLIKPASKSSCWCWLWRYGVEGHGNKPRLLKLEYAMKLRPGT